MGKRTPALTRDEKADLNLWEQERYPICYDENAEKGPLWRRVRPQFGFSDWREPFLQQVALHQKLASACLETGLKFTEVKSYLQRCRADGIDDAFLECYEIARQLAQEHLEMSMLQRAHGGDTFAGIFMLKAMDPETYVHPLQVNSKIEKHTRHEIDLRASVVDYRSAVQALAPPEYVEGEARELAAPVSTED